MSDDIKYTNNPRNGKSIAGVILLVVGVLLLIKQFNLFFFPYWLFSFPMALIALGFFIGAKNNFRSIGSVALIIIGTAFLLDDIIPGANMHNITWPIMIIGFGIWLILKRNRKNADRKFSSEDKWNSRGFNTPQPADPIVDYTVNPTATPPPVDPGAPTGNPGNPDDYLDAVSVFGGVKKAILSKDFKGGEVINAFGGVELDFTQANINGSVIIDITQVFGGIKIIVPANWKVVSDLAAVFASVDDKRLRTVTPVDTDKVLVLKGTSFFAGVDIRSY